MRQLPWLKTRSSAINHFLLKLYKLLLDNLLSQCLATANIPRHCKSFLMYKTLNFPSNLISSISHISRQKHITKENKSEKHAQSRFTIYIFFVRVCWCLTWLSHTEQTNTIKVKSYFIYEGVNEVLHDESSTKSWTCEHICATINLSTH